MSFRFVPHALVARLAKLLKLNSEGGEESERLTETGDV